MNSISSDFKKYKIILLWLDECKHYTKNSQPLGEDAFIKEMQSHNYVKISCIDNTTSTDTTNMNNENNEDNEDSENNKNNGDSENNGDKTKIDIVLISSSSRIESGVDSFRRLLKALNVKENTQYNNRKLIIITKYPFSTNVLKTKSAYNIGITNYLHSNFSCDKRRGPMCYPHKVMSAEEVKLLTEFYYNKASDYPPICLDDPQCIWLNAKPGDLIEITRVEDNAAGKTITYRYVTTKKFDMSNKSKTSDLNLSNE